MMNKPEDMLEALKKWEQDLAVIQLGRLLKIRGGSPSALEIS